MVRHHEFRRDDHGERQQQSDFRLDTESCKHAAVSGQVPVTLISGITLVSGTLTYFPATNPQGVVT